MPSRGYQYGGLEAELYDELDELSEFDDLHFYEWFASASPGPILDVGCGTGRVLLPLVEKGFEVCGLDNSQAMLDICRERLREIGGDAKLVVGDMRSFDIGELRFGMVVIPGFSIQMLESDEDVIACFRNCREHLREGGQLLVTTHMPWEMIWDGREVIPMEERCAKTLPNNEGSLVAWQGWKIDSISQRLLLKNRYERLAANGDVLEVEEKEMWIRWHLPHDMMRLLGEAGFSDVSVYGDFGFEPPEADSDSIIYLAEV